MNNSINVNSVIGFTNSNELYLDSRDVSEMMDIKHFNLMQKIVGISTNLDELNFQVVNYWTESSYKDKKNETRKCYLITRKGCEFLANKTTGIKGDMFTALYINKFHEMENELNQPKLPTDFKSALIRLLEEVEHNERLELENKELTSTIEIQKPNVEFATKIQDDNEELYDMGSVCRILKLKIGRNALFLYLRTEKVLMSSVTNKNIPYQSYMDRGYFKVTLDIVNGNPFKVTKMTGKGLRWLNDKMNLGIDIDKELELENEVTDNLIDELEKEVMW